jgi:hypothetical protein
MVRHYPKHLFTVSGFSKLKKEKLNLGNIGSNYYGTLSGDAVAPRKIFLRKIFVQDPIRTQKMIGQLGHNSGAAQVEKTENERKNQKIIITNTVLKYKRYRTIP